jgi:hypothetical protein
LVVLLGTFLIPIGLSSLRGLTHVLTCSEGAEVPFTLIVPEQGDPVIISAATVTRDDPEGLCGGLFLDLAAGRTDSGRLSLRVPITNGTKYGWHGTVKLRLGDTVIPVAIGAIGAGDTGVETLETKLEPGQLEINGSLLVGP